VRPGGSLPVIENPVYHDLAQQENAIANYAEFTSSRGNFLFQLFKRLQNDIAVQLEVFVFVQLAIPPHRWRVRSS